MFTLSFGYSASKHYKKALEIAHGLGGSMEKGTMNINFPDWELLYTYDKVSPLLQLVQNWKSVTGNYNNKKVDVLKFLYNIWRNIGFCAQQRNDTWDSRHCWLNCDNEGWGCKLLNSFSAYNYGEGRYQRSNRFWYNFGEYSGTRVWKVNKRLIFEKLQKEVDSKTLQICPFFNIEKVKEIIEKLPEKIAVDDLTYIPFFNENNEMVNIRHAQLAPYHKPELHFSFN